MNQRNCVSEWVCTLYSVQCTKVQIVVDVIMSKKRVRREILFSRNLKTKTNFILQNSEILLQNFAVLWHKERQNLKLICKMISKRKWNLKSPKGQKATIMDFFEQTKFFYSIRALFRTTFNYSNDGDDGNDDDNDDDASCLFFVCYLFCFFRILFANRNEIFDAKFG